MSNKIKTIFIGTPDFGIPSLNALIEDELFDVLAVITQPDKKKGRKQILSPPPIKVGAEKNNIPVLQPLKIADCGLRIAELRADIIIVTAYAQILPKNILELPKYGCINIHGSLLPYCRGASCIQAPIIRDDKKTGVTIMKMDEGLDTGPILAQRSIPIEDADTTGTLFEKLSVLGAELLIPTLKNYIAGKITPKPQNDNQKTRVRTLKKEDGRIDWSKYAEEIERFIRAMSPWPGAFSDFRLSISDCRLKTIKINAVKHTSVATNKHKVGELFINNKELVVQCGKDALIIKKIQPEAKKSMNSKEFINGYGHLIGTILK